MPSEDRLRHSIGCWASSHLRGMSPWFPFFFLIHQGRYYSVLLQLHTSQYIYEGGEQTVPRDQKFCKILCKAWTSAGNTCWRKHPSDWGLPPRVKRQPGVFTCVSQPCRSTLSSFRSFSSLPHLTHIRIIYASGIWISKYERIEKREIYSELHKEL